jgi:hypothetical protein
MTEHYLIRFLFLVLMITFVLHTCIPPKNWTSNSEDFWGVKTPKIDYIGGIISLGIASFGMLLMVLRS